MKAGWMFTDGEDSADLLLVRIFGFTLLSISYSRHNWFSVTVLGAWIQRDLY